MGKRTDHNIPRRTWDWCCDRLPCNQCLCKEATCLSVQKKSFLRRIGRRTYCIDALGSICRTCAVTFIYRPSRCHRREAQGECSQLFEQNICHANSYDRPCFLHSSNYPRNVASDNHRHQSSALRPYEVECSAWTRFLGYSLGKSFVDVACLPLFPSAACRLRFVEQPIQYVGEFGRKSNADVSSFETLSGGCRSDSDDCGRSFGYCGLVVDGRGVGYISKILGVYSDPLLWH
jgi:hypothetical protein